MELIDPSILELFRADLEGQTAALTEGLLALERSPQDALQLERLMRAAHSLKGAARMTNLDLLARVAHAMEDCFVAAQRGKVVLERAKVDLLLRTVDLMSRLGNAAGTDSSKDDPEAAHLIKQLNSVEKGEEIEAPAKSKMEVFPQLAKAEIPRSNGQALANGHCGNGHSINGHNGSSNKKVQESESGRKTDRVLRITAGSLDQLLGLAGESMVQSRWLDPFAQTMLRLKRAHHELARSLDGLRDAMDSNDTERSHVTLAKAQEQAEHCRLFLSDRLAELELFTRNSANLSHRLYSEVLTSRMRPFADGVQGFPRMVRDVSHSLGKEVELEIIGGDTQVDRDILERIEAPLNHLLRNAIDHGIELPEDRVVAAKARKGTIRLEARHSAGMLLIFVSDDGRGLDPERLRQTIVKRKLATTEMAASFSEAELLEFLFLPGFSMKEAVTEISGRGVGLDVVQSMVKELRGTVRVASDPGKGMSFQLQLPLTLSVIRTLLVEIGGEPYAFPLARLVSAVKVKRESLEVLQGRQHFAFRGQQIGIVDARQVLELEGKCSCGDELSVVIFGDRATRYGLIVDRFLGEKDLVVQPLDRLLGKLQNINSAALMTDGSPVLIVDLDDLTRSVQKIVSENRLQKAGTPVETSDGNGKRKRVLIVDDSLTVRELERKLLQSRGYEADVAVDGMDGWNAIRTGNYDLIISDVDMPRMDGIELVQLIKKDNRLKTLPAMIVSYKDREQDRQRGLEAGADYYLTKGSFHDESLIHAVTDLIGAA